MRTGRRKGFRRQFGLDRSGPPPRQTRPGQPLRPWTIPNAVGYIRLAALPVFLVIAFSSGDGRDPWAAAIFWLIAVGDYVDGFLSRADTRVTLTSGNRNGCRFVSASTSCSL